MKRSIFLIASTLLVAACDTEPLHFDDEPAQAYLDYSNLTLSELLMTAESDAGSGNSWFCTTTRLGQFVDRNQWYILGDGVASIGGDHASWGVSDTQLHLTIGNNATTYGNIVFSRRFQFADMLSAETDNGTKLNCDWSGPPRPGFVFDDPELTQNIEEITHDTIDVLLTTGRVGQEQTAYWSCRDSSYPFSNVDLSLLDDGTVQTGSIGRWSRVNSTTLKIDVNGLNETWRDVQISEYEGETFGRFTATRLENTTVECLWQGRARSSAWEPN